MSSLLLLNGSPRGAGSNSMKMLSRVADGWQTAAETPRPADAAVEILHLAKRSDFERAVEAFGQGDTALIGMPLYADAMPALVKEYFERLAPYIGRESNPRMAFLVQCGFAEALHCRGVERYFERLAGRLSAPYAGTIVRGSGESLRTMPSDANKKLWARLNALGESLRREGRFDPNLLAELAGVERFGPVTAAALGVALKLPLMGMMWPELKKNGAWDRRDARPYVSA
jgi:Flavodoxin-like fold